MRHRGRGWLLLLALGCARGGEARDREPAGSGAYAPLPHRVMVQVSNGGRVEGASRAATHQLRAAGLDVVLIDNAPAALVDTLRRGHLVLVRGGDTTGVGRIGAVLGPVEVRDVPDRTWQVDLTVVLYRDPPRDTASAP